MGQRELEAALILSGWKYTYNHPSMRICVLDKGNAKVKIYKNIKLVEKLTEERQTWVTITEENYSKLLAI